jgi:hypothetical protein
VYSIYIVADDTHTAHNLAKPLPFTTGYKTSDGARYSEENVTGKHLKELGYLECYLKQAS